MKELKMKKFLTVFAFLLFSIAVHAQAWGVAGAFNGWNNALDGLYDDGTHGDAVAGDGIFTGQVTVATAGRYEWKATLWGSWATAFPNSNSWLITTSPNQVVTFTLNTNTISDNWMPASNIVNANDDPSPIVAVGDWQGWNNSGTQVMHDDGLAGDAVAGDGIFTYHAVIASAGTYQYKPVVQGSWDAWGIDSRNIDAATQTFTTTVPNQNVYLYLNKKTGRISSSAQSTALHLDFTAFIQARFNESDSKMIPDTVTVELRAENSPYNLVESQKGLLDENGYHTFYFTTAVNSVPYWFVVKHRNSIETWSLAPVVLSSSPIFDFTWSQGSAYGNNLIQVGTKFCFYSGDVNQDGFITNDDFTGVDNDASLGDYHAENDVNGDGFVTNDDFTCIDNNASIGVSRQVPPGAPGHLANHPVKHNVSQ
jgi:hypothetical protein